MIMDLNIEKHCPDDILTIAHRGGIVGNGAHENSRLSILRAIKKGYDMVEIDIMPTTDHYPILAHIAWHIPAENNNGLDYEYCFEKKSFSQVSKERHPWNNETIMTIDEALAICKDKIGVMLDIKIEGSDMFYKHIVQAIDEYEFAGKCLILASDNDKNKEFFQDRVKYIKDPSQLQNIETKTIRDGYIFRIPRINKNRPLSDKYTLTDLSGSWWNFDSSEIKKTPQECNLAVIIAINTFQYSIYEDAEKLHMQYAKEDIEYYRHAGVDGFQFDSVYQDYIF